MTVMWKMQNKAPKAKTYFINNCSLTFGEQKNDFFEIETDPPLKFLAKDSLPGEFKLEHSSLAAVVVCPLGEGMVRTVIHQADRLDGGAGISYGAGTAIIMDTCPSLQVAMEALGYRQVDRPQGDASAEAMLLTGTCWEVWPEGGNDWILTHDREFAKSVYAKSPTSVLQYKQVPVNFTPTKAEQQSTTES